MNGIKKEPCVSAQSSKRETKNLCIPNISNIVSENNLVFRSSPLISVPIALNMTSSSTQTGSKGFCLDPVCVSFPPESPVSVSYLDSICTSGGGSKVECGSARQNKALDNDYDYVVWKSDCCGSTLVKLWNYEKQSVGFLPVICRKFWCPTCGGKKGKIHNKRISKLIERINFQDFFFRQLIFTLPELNRSSFKSREALNSFIGICVRIVKKHFPGQKFIEYLHINGDNDPGKFHPHVNIHVIESLQVAVWKITHEKLDSIKADYLKAIRAFLQDYSVPVVDVNYSYRVGAGKMAHAIRYMSRPFDAGILESNDERFKELAVVGLQSFHSIRYYGFKKGDDYIDDLVLKVPKGYEFMKIVQRWEVEEYLERENKVFNEGDDGVLYAIDRPG